MPDDPQYHQRVVSTGGSGRRVESDSTTPYDHKQKPKLIAPKYLGDLCVRFFTTPLRIATGNLLDQFEQVGNERNTDLSKIHNPTKRRCSPDS